MKKCSLVCVHLDISHCQKRTFGLQEFGYFNCRIHGHMVHKQTAAGCSETGHCHQTEVLHVAAPLTSLSRMPWVRLPAEPNNKVWPACFFFPSPDRIQSPTSQTDLPQFNLLQAHKMAFVFVSQTHLSGQGKIPPPKKHSIDGAWCQWGLL